MARYLGPRVKKMRALGILLPGLSAKSIERRPYPPGQHGLQRSWESPALARPDWIVVDVDAMTARMAAPPPPKSVPFDIFPQLVIEFYAKRL